MKSLNKSSTSDFEHDRESGKWCEPGMQEQIEWTYERCIETKVGAHGFRRYPDRV